MEKTIGILGGMGPLATADLFRKITLFTKAGCDNDHIRVYIDSNAQIPDRTAAILNGGKDPLPEMRSALHSLEACGADCVIMPCNTAHSPRILSVALERLRETGLDVTFVSIIESAVKHVRSMCPNGGRIGLMGTVATLQTRLYQDALEKVGLEPVLPDDEDCALVQRAISDPEFGIKAFSDPVSAKARQILLDTVRRLVEEKQVSVVLLGCTEIPVAVTESRLWDTPVVDATSVLARELIRASCPERLKEPSNIQC